MIRFTEEKTVVPPDSSVSPKTYWRNVSGLVSITLRAGNIHHCINGIFILKTGSV